MTDININLTLTPRQAHLLSIACSLNETIPDAAYEKSAFLAYERTATRETAMTQTSQMQQALLMLKIELRNAAGTCYSNPTSEVFTNHPEGLI